MSQTLNSVPAFDGSNYGYWKARMRFFLKSIDCWGIVETGWTKPEDTTPELVPQKMQNMMELMMQSCQPPPTRRQTWAEKDSYPRRGNRRT